MTTQEKESNLAALPPELRELLETRDANAFEASLDTLFARRQSHLFRALGHLTRDLHNSIVQLTLETGEPPAGTHFARQSLHEALTMSAGAAHDTLAIIERLRPRAMQLRGGADALIALDAIEPDAASKLAHDASRFAGDCLEDFTQLVEKQSWQDLSGQRLQKVSGFIDKVEHSLLELARLAGSLGGAPVQAEPSERAVSTQEEVDRLLSEFGF